MLLQSDRPVSFGRYRPIAILGEGGQAQVYLTLMQGPAGFNKLTVVKALKPYLLDDGDSLSRFLKEARLAARLNHPNIVLTHEVVEAHGKYFIAMEYLEGQSLSSLLKRLRELDRSLSLVAHVSVLRDMLAGLHYAHQLSDYDGKPLNVVHRDVSPQNVFVSYEGQTKLLDFGVASVEDASVATQARSLRGKFAYMAPEQARGEVVDRRADVFSAGVMLWEAIAGHRFNRGLNEAETLTRRLTGADQKIRDVVPSAPAGLAEICDKATAPDRADRYASAGELRTALEDWLDAQTVRSTSGEVGKLVAEVFAEERAELRARIERQVRLAEDAPRSGFSLPNFGASVYEPSPFTSGSSTSGPDEPTLAGTPAARRRHGEPRLVLVAAIALLIVGVTVAVTYGGRVRRPTGAAVTTDPGTLEATHPDATVAARVRISIRVTPESADLFLDEARVSVPMEIEVAQDGVLHQVRASAPGYVTERRAVVFNQDVKLELRLERESAAQPVARPVVKPPIAALPPSGSTNPPPKPSAVKGIDETNPYTP